MLVAGRGYPPTYLQLAALLDSYLAANDLALDAEQKDAFVVHLAKQGPRDEGEAEAAIEEFLSPPTETVLAEMVSFFTTSAELALDDATQ